MISYSALVAKDIESSHRRPRGLIPPTYISRDPLAGHWPPQPAHGLSKLKRMTPAETREWCAARGLDPKTLKPVKAVRPVKPLVFEVEKSGECPICRKTFEVTAQHKRYCSDECYQRRPHRKREARGRAVPCSLCGASVRRQRVRRIVRCDVCKAARSREYLHAYRQTHRAQHREHQRRYMQRKVAQEQPCAPL